MRVPSDDYSRAVVRVLDVVRDERNRDGLNLRERVGGGVASVDEYFAKCSGGDGDVGAIGGEGDAV